MKRYLGVLNEQHFDALKGITEGFDGINRKLDRHEKILNNHTEILNNHTKILASHTETLESHTEMIGQLIMDVTEIKDARLERRVGKLELKLAK